MKIKIKFIKEYVAVDPATNSGIIHRFGETEEIEEYTAEWLIDSGFAEKVKANEWWKPKKGEAYYYLDDSGIVTYRIWVDDNSDENRFRIGNCFKTREATKKWRDYLKAIATVRQDEGAMTLRGTIDAADVGAMVGRIIVNDMTGNLAVSMCNLHSDEPSVGTIYFGNCKQAQASLDKHPDEWKIIVNYDWGRETEYVYKERYAELSNSGKEDK